jgi:hypothetical protein
MFMHNFAQLLFDYYKPCSLEADEKNHHIILMLSFSGYTARGKPPSTSPHSEDGTQGKP